MNIFKRGSRDKIVSLDIGSDSIKILVTQGTYPGKFFVCDYRLLQINTTGDGVEPAEISTILKSILPDLKIGTANVRTVVSGKASIVRVIEMPEMSRNDLKKTVAYQLARYIPMRPEDVQFDCTPLPDSSVRRGFQKCLLVVVRRNALNDLNGIMDSCDLTPLLIDAEPIAVTNCYLACSQDFDREQGIPRVDNQAGTVLVHIGAGHTDMIILREQVPLVCRTLETGTSSLFKTLAESTHVSYVEAIDMMAVAKPPEGEPNQAVHEFSESLLREIRTSLDYCSREYDLKTERLYVSGAPASNAQLCQAMAAALELPVYRFDPFVNIPMNGLGEMIGDFRSKAPAFVPALGLAVRTLA